MKIGNVFKTLFIILLVVMSSVCLYVYYNYFYTIQVEVESIYVDDNDHLVIKLNDQGKCSFIGGIEDSRWVSTNGDNACILEKQNSYDTLYLRNKYTYLSEYDKDISYINDLKITNSNTYLAVNGKMKIDYEIDYFGKLGQDIKYSVSDNSIASIDENGNLIGLTDGLVKVNIESLNKTDSVDIIVSDLIIPVSKEYDFDKPFIECGQYSKLENDIFDEILKMRIKEAQYHTRAAAVAAARFFEFELPFQVGYFSENGRINSYVNRYADGEGRYYHEGLYLNESRYENLNSDMIAKGPACWGCELYEYDGEKYLDNGLDCSGYVSWILLQAGYDPGDLGAGIAEWDDLTKLGKMIDIEEAVKKDLIRVGDLLSGSEISAQEGGHIAFIIGKDDEYIYTSEALWQETGYFGVVVRKHSKQDLIDNYYWHIDMDEYYGEDGLLTDFWYYE